MKKKFLITFFLSLVFFAGLYWVANRVLDIMEVTSKVEFLDHELGDGNKIEQAVADELLFLVLGMDSDDFSGVTNERNRTDTMILAKVNFKTGNIDVLSIPRDSRVLINGNFDKINHAHHFGGLKLAMKTTRDFLNLDIDYYVKLNFFSVKDIVNALGGVEVDVPVTVDVAEDNVHLEPGLQVLNGAQALQFARFRKGYAEGDLGRVKAQQLLIKALVKEITKPKNIVKIPEILEIAKKTISTNIPFSTMAKLALKAGNLSTDKLNAKIVPGEGQYIGDISYYVPDGVALREIINTTYKDYILNPNAQIQDQGNYNNNSNQNNWNNNNNNNNNSNWNNQNNNSNNNNNSNSNWNNQNNQNNNQNNVNNQNNGGNQENNQNNQNNNQNNPQNNENNNNPVNNPNDNQNNDNNNSGNDNNSGENNGNNGN